MSTLSGYTTTYDFWGTRFSQMSLNAISLHLTLDQVTGGRRSASSGSATDRDDRILDAIEGLKSAITDLGKSRSAQNSNGLEMLLPLLLSQMGGSRGGGGGTGSGPCGGAGNGTGGGRY